MKVDTDVLLILERSECLGTCLRLPKSQLERPLYMRVDAALKAAGGKWDRKAGGHLFQGSAADAIEALILTGEIAKPQDFGFFETPVELARRVIRLSELTPGMTVLEPSAGKGRLADLARGAGGHVLCVELLSKNCEVLLAKQHSVIPMQDFLAFDVPILPARFDRVVMNPPFAGRADIHHIMHAAKFLKPGGRLVSIASASVLFRQDKLACAFRDFIGASEGIGSIEALPEGSFKESGTMVNTALVIYDAEE